MNQSSGARPGEHTTPVLVFDQEGGERLVTRSGEFGAFGVFAHTIPGAAVFTLPPGVDRQLESKDLNLAVRQLRTYAKHKGDFVTPILSLDGQVIELGEMIDMGTPDPMLGCRFEWGDQGCALVVTKSVDPLLNVTSGQVYTYDHSWVDPKPGILDRLLGGFFGDR